MTRTLHIAAGLAAGLLLTSAALAAESTLQLDPAATHVTFDLDATGHDVHGTLALQEGVVRFDPATGDASGRIVIDAKKAATGTAAATRRCTRRCWRPSPSRASSSSPASSSGRCR